MQSIPYRYRHGRKKKHVCRVPTQTSGFLKRVTGTKRGCSLLPLGNSKERENEKRIIFGGMYLALFLGLLLNLGNLLSLGAGSRNLHSEDDVPLKN